MLLKYVTDYIYVLRYSHQKYFRILSRFRCGHSLFKIKTKHYHDWPVKCRYYTVLMHFMDKKVGSSQHKVLCVAINNLASHITCVCIHNKQSLPVEFVVLLPKMAVLFKYIQQLLISQPYFTDFSVFQIMLHNK